jgi:hypothetical protein
MNVMRSLLDLILPTMTLDGGARSLTGGLSAETWSRITFISDPACDGCGAPFEYDLGGGVRCADCMAKHRPFARARRLPL